MTRVEYRDRPVPTPVPVPGGMLVPCQVTPMPIPGDTWQDAWVTMVAKDKEQATCNERFEQIREWQRGELDGEGAPEPDDEG